MDMQLLMAAVAFIVTLWLLSRAYRALMGLGKDRRKTAIYQLGYRHLFGFECVYVGQSVNPEARYQQHMKETNTALAKLIRERGRPEMRIVQWVPRYEANDAERAEIGRHSHLVNRVGNKGRRR
jgi:hypothetical protein